MSFKDQLIQMDPMERRTFLETNAESVNEGMSYIYQFTDEELEQMRRDFVEVSQKLRKIEDEKAEVMLEFRERIKIPKSTAAELLGHITDGFEKREGTIYVLHDYEENKIISVNEHGHILTERSLAKGVQTSVLSIKSKTA